MRPGPTEACHESIASLQRGNTSSRITYLVNDFLEMAQHGWRALAVVRLAGFGLTVMAPSTRCCGALSQTLYLTSGYYAAFETACRKQ